MKQSDVFTAPTPASADAARSEEHLHELDETSLEQVTGGGSGLAMEADIVANDLGPDNVQ